MTCEEILKKLESSGTEKNRQKLQTLGAGNSVFGVSESNLKKLAEKTGPNHELGLQLWDSGFIEAQRLATMIIEPARLTPDDMDRMVATITYYEVADAFVKNVVVQTPHILPKMKLWIQSEKEYIKRCGYTLLALLAEAVPSPITNEEWLEYIYTIEKEISTSPNRSREAMNAALIAIGKRNKLLNMEALIIGMRMGRIIIEHGGKEVRTPYAMDILGEKKLKQSFLE